MVSILFEYAPYGFETTTSVPSDPLVLWDSGEHGDSFLEAEDLCHKKDQTKDLFYQGKQDITNLYYSTMNPQQWPPHTDHVCDVDISHKF